MKEYSLGYNELMEFPYEKYLEFAKILSLESKEEKKKQNQSERQMQKAT